MTFVLEETGLTPDAITHLSFVGEGGMAEIYSKVMSRFFYMQPAGGIGGGALSGN